MILVKCPNAFLLRKLAQNAQSLRRDPAPRKFAENSALNSGIVKCPTAFRLARTKSASRSWPRHFCCEFSHTVGLVKCPGSCRLRRLAQSASPFWAPAFLLRIFAHSGSCQVSKCNNFDCAGSCKVCVPSLSPFLRILTYSEWVLSNVQEHFDCAGSRKVCADLASPLNSSQGGSCEMRMSIATAKAFTKRESRFWGRSSSTSSASN